MPNGAVHSKLSKLEIKTGTNTWVQCKGLTDVSGIGGGSPGIIDITDMDSTAKEKLMGLKDEGQPTFNFNFIPADAGQLALESARSSDGKATLRVTFGTGTGAPVYAFDALIMTFEVGAAVDKQLPLSVKAEITGSLTKTLLP